jgi:hypothetical protein
MEDRPAEAAVADDRDRPGLELAYAVGVDDAERAQVDEPTDARIGRGATTLRVPSVLMSRRLAPPSRIARDRGEVDDRFGAFERGARLSMFVTSARRVDGRPPRRRQAGSPGSAPADRGRGRTAG